MQGFTPGMDAQLCSQAVRDHAEEKINSVLQPWLVLTISQDPKEHTAFQVTEQNLEKLQKMIKKPPF